MNDAIFSLIETKNLSWEMLVIFVASNFNATHNVQFNVCHGQRSDSIQGTDNIAFLLEFKGSKDKN